MLARKLDLLEGEVRRMIDLDHQTMIRIDDSPLPKGLMISLQPRRTTATPSRAEVGDNGEFSIPFAVS